MTAPTTVILGLGKTGLSCARFLARQAKPFLLMDDRQNPPAFIELQREFPEVPVHLGAFDEQILEQAQEIIVSPGISLQQPAIHKQVLAGKSVLGDIELFARCAPAPVVAITGSNGKSTVTTLLGAMVKQAGLAVQVAGNIGMPVLDVLQQPKPDWYVLELSSFQLETTTSLQPYAATILNVTEDHMDRYDSFADYKNAKQRIYNNCQHIIYNREDIHTQPEFSHPSKTTLDMSFGLNQPIANQFGIIIDHDRAWLTKGSEKLLNVKQLRIIGKHNWANALAALALGDAMELPLPAMLEALTAFNGLPHRCEWVGERQGVQWYNDSKATNVGAANAAIEGLGQIISGKLIVLAGGVGKDADFMPLQQPLAKHARAVLLFGVDAPQIAKVIPANVKLLNVQTMQQAIQQAAQLAQPGDAVLLAPACASFDMFDNFEHRGEMFKQEVQARFV